ncbi:MAG: gamma-glutamylcyclotransferase [Sneathiellaceae bacterium]
MQDRQDPKDGDAAEPLPQRIHITRDEILNGYAARVERLRAAGMPVLTEEELEASRSGILAAHPGGAGPAGGDRPVWMFGYGSLIWNPAFHFAEARPSRIHGWHRSFCFNIFMGRGSRTRPGLMLALDRGGCCAGLAYRIAPEAVEQETGIIWRREMMSGAYHPRWVRAVTPDGPVPALAFVMNRSHPRYTGRLPDAEVTERLAFARGELGTGAEYLFNTVEHLRDLGIADRRLEALAAMVRARQAAAREVSPG